MACVFFGWRSFSWSPIRAHTHTQRTHARCDHRSQRSHIASNWRPFFPRICSLVWFDPSRLWPEFFFCAQTLDPTHQRRFMWGFLPRPAVRRKGILQSPLDGMMDFLSSGVKMRWTTTKNTATTGQNQYILSYLACASANLPTQMQFFCRSVIWVRFASAFFSAGAQRPLLLKFGFILCIKEPDWE